MFKKSKYIETLKCIYTDFKKFIKTSFIALFF